MNPNITHTFSSNIFVSHNAAKACLNDNCSFRRTRCAERYSIRSERRKGSAESTCVDQVAENAARSSLLPVVVLTFPLVSN